MTDMITGAKRLLKHTTPGPWRIDDSIDPERPELQGAPVVENGLVSVPILFNNIFGYVSLEDAELIAAAPEIAAVLAQETYEYAMQVKHGDEWCTFSNDETHSEEWWPDKSDPEEDIHRVDAMRETRIVRRRVSPPEVME